MPNATGYHLCIKSLSTLKHENNFEKVSRQYLSLKVHVKKKMGSLLNYRYGKICITFRYAKWLKLVTSDTVNSRHNEPPI